MANMLLPFAPPPPTDTPLAAPRTPITADYTRSILKAYFDNTEQRVAACVEKHVARLDAEILKAAAGGYTALSGIAVETEAVDKLVADYRVRGFKVVVGEPTESGRVTELKIDWKEQ